MEFVVGFIDWVVVLGIIVLLAVVTTAPIAAIGWITARRSAPAHRHYLVETKAHRRVVWGTGSAAAVVGMIAMGLGNTTLGMPFLILGTAMAHYAAFFIGHMAAERSHAHRNDHLYSPLPEGLGPQHETYPEHLRGDEHAADDTSQTRPLPLNQFHDSHLDTEDMERAAREANMAAVSADPEYPVAQPQEGPLT